MEHKQARVPKEHLGKWIAWDRKTETIIASGESFGEVRQAAKKAGKKTEPLMEKVPRGLFVGS